MAFMEPKINQNPQKQMNFSFESRFGRFRSKKNEFFDKIGKIYEETTSKISPNSNSRGENKEKNEENNQKNEENNEKNEQIEKKFTKEKRFQTPPSKEKENSECKILHDILISTKNSQNKSFAKEFVLTKARNLKTEDFPAKNSKIEEKKEDFMNEREFLRKENEFLKNNLTNLLSEHHLLKETNVQLNNLIDDMRQNYEKLGKKYKDKKEYNKKLLDLLKIQGKFTLKIKQFFIFLLYTSFFMIIYRISDNLSQISIYLL